MYQFSLRNLLIAVACVGIGTAALLSANSWWSSILWAAAVFILLVAIPFAIYRREGKRAFWIGYALAGSFYLLLMFQPLTPHNLITGKVIYWAYSLLPASKTTQYLPAPNPATGTGGTTATNINGGGIADGIPGGPGAGIPGGGGMLPPGAGGMPGMGMPGMPGGLPGGFPPPMIINPSFIDQTDFAAVGNALWTLLISWLGGTIAFWIYRTRDAASTPAPQPRS